MKLYHCIIFIGLCCIQYASSQLSCPNIPYTRLVTTTLTTIQANAKAMMTRANITLTNNYTGQSQYWGINSVSQNYYAGVYNTTTALIYFIGNITAAVANTKTADYPTKINDLNSMATALSSDDAYGSSSVIPTYLSSNYTTSITNFKGLAGTFNTMMTASDDSNLAYMNKQKTSQNFLQCLPSPIQMFNWQTNLNYQIGNLSYILGNATKDMDFAYYTFKSSDSSVIALEKQFNYTIGNFSSSINKTMIAVNASMFSYVSQVNSSLVKANAALPSSVQNNFISNFITAFNTTLIGLSNAVSTMFGTFNTSLNTNLTTLNTTVLSAYPNLTQWTEGRSSIFTSYLSNVTTLTCASQAVNATERLFTAMGGAPRIFNCSDVEAVLFQNIQNIMNASVAVIASETFIESNYIKNCTYPSLSQTSNATIEYSKTDCVALYGALFNSSLDTSSPLNTTMAGLITSLQANIVQLFTNSANRLTDCYASRLNRFKFMTTAIQANATTCYGS